MTTHEYVNTYGDRFTFGRTASDNACLEFNDDKRYVFTLDEEMKLAEFFAERQPPQVAQSEGLPEPVDPASVRVGDVVEIKTPLWRIEAECIGHPSDGYLGIRTDQDRSIRVADATVRVLQSADEAAVEALAQMMREANGTERAKAEWDRSPQLVPVVAYAEYLVRRGVIVPRVDRDE